MGADPDFSSRVESPGLFNENLTCSASLAEFVVAEVTAHVAAETVEDVDLSVAAAEHDQLLAEGLDVGTPAASMCRMLSSFR